MKHGLSALLGLALLLAPAAAAAETLGNDTLGNGDASGRRAPPRIIYGESQGATFDFGELRVPRRTNAGKRQAYFGSGEDYSAALARLRDRLRAMTERSRPDSPALESAEGGMPPALRRALTLAREARDDAVALD